jgi:hypothetical protein
LPSLPPSPPPLSRPQVTARSILTTNNAARLLSAAEQYRANTLRTACMAYIHKNMNDCAHNTVRTLAL